MMRNFAYCCTVLVCLTSVYGITLPFLSSKVDDDYLCCIPSDWEGLMFLDFGTVFIDSNTAFAYFNGTVKTAYSFTKKKVYFNIKGVEQSPLIPKPVPDDSIVYYDYENGTVYTVTAGGGCQKAELDNMTQQCIPANAKLISTGMFGENGYPISTYRFTRSSDIQWQITASVIIQDLHPSEPRRCTPVQLIYFTPSVNPDSGSYYTYQVMDVGPLKSPDVFKVPKQCL